MVIIGGEEVKSILQGKEREVIAAVSSAYMTHAAGNSSLPYSLFLRFPCNPRDRIIALPAHLGGGHPLTGIKWISSFPANVRIGLDRASAVLIVNSSSTGHPEAILEGSVISAKRTAASAALAASHLHTRGECSSVGIIGCGVINYEIVRFLTNVFSSIKRFILFDQDPDKADRVQSVYEQVAAGANVLVARERERVLERCELISFATTATTPYLDDLSMCANGSTILHISLRDLSVNAILSSDNVVDDIDHVCRAETSLHLAEKASGDRVFIRCSLGDILLGRAVARLESHNTLVFSPFGLGILDLAVGDLVLSSARKEGRGLQMASFVPEAWSGQEHV